jgi:hypothetical protein
MDIKNNWITSVFYSNKIEITLDEMNLFINLNRFLNDNAVLFKTNYIDIKSSVHKLFFTKNTRSIGISCNMEDDELISTLYPWYN